MTRVLETRFVEHGRYLLTLSLAASVTGRRPDICSTRTSLVTRAPTLRVAPDLGRMGMRGRGRAVQQDLSNFK